MGEHDLWLYIIIRVLVYYRFPGLVSHVLLCLVLAQAPDGSCFFPFGGAAIAISTASAPLQPHWSSAAALAHMSESVLKKKKKK